MRRGFNRPMVRRALLGATLALTLGALWAVVPLALAAPGAWHEDEKFGYKIRPPRDWTSIPMQPDEKWVVAKFLSEKQYFFTDDSDGWTYDHKPDITVIAFVTEVVKRDGVEVSELEDGFLLELNNPYKDYQDYMRRTYSGGGWFISKEEEDEEDGIPVTKYEIKVEKLTRTGPKRIVTWIFHTEEVDFAVQCEMLEGAYRKLKGPVYQTLRSFEIIPRTHGNLTPVTTGERTAPVDETELTPEDREEHRKETEATLHKKASEGLPEGWTVKEMGRFLVLNHADEKYARKIVAQAEAVWSWLDDTFPYVGEGEYVRRPILRICKDADEERAFRSGTSWGNSLDITTHKDSGSGAMSYELEYVNRRVLAIWFNHRDRDLYYALPYWLDHGLEQVLGTARTKGRGLEFQPDSWERDGLREAVRSETVTPPRTLMQLGNAEFYEQRTRGMEAAALVRYFLESRNKKVRVVLEDYLKTMKLIIEEVKAASDADKPAEYKPAETEEEEEERFRQQRQAWKDQEDTLLAKVFDRAFADWTEKDWKKFDVRYFKSLD